MNYELDTYLDALQHFPENCDVLQVAKGNAFLVKKDIFKNLMWYTLPDSNKQYPLSIERVNNIKSLNQQGIRPEELEPVDLSSKTVEKEPEFVELVGQISLKSLDKAAADKKRKQHQQGNQQRNQQGGNQQRPPQRQQGQGRGQQGGNQQGGQQQRPNNPNRNQQGGQQQRPNNPNRNQQRPNNPNRNQQGGNQQRPNNPDGKKE